VTKIYFAGEDIGILKEFGKTKHFKRLRKRYSQEKIWNLTLVQKNQC
jgi:hypothetical protein